MKKPVIFFSLTVFLVLISCEDNEPVTPVEEPPGRLDSYTDTYEIPGLDFKPVQGVTYEYDSSGRVSRYTVSSYNPDTDAMDELHHFVFSYGGDKVHTLKGYLPNSAEPYVEYLYHYTAAGEVSIIEENNHSAGLTSEAKFSYSENGDSVMVAYAYSNGGRFEYRYVLENGNLVSDKTTRGGELCSEGYYTYDEHVNPFKSLNYTSYALTNLSANNRLTEEVTYISCSFPNLVPESYTYEYDEEGYPTLATTIYRGEPQSKVVREFIYR